MIVEWQVRSIIRRDNLIPDLFIFIFARLIIKLFAWLEFYFMKMFTCWVLFKIYFIWNFSKYISHLNSYENILKNLQSTLTGNCDVFHMWFTCVSHVIHMWFTCEIPIIQVILKTHVFPMWLVLHMWNFTCDISHVKFHMWNSHVTCFSHVKFHM